MRDAKEASRWGAANLPAYNITVAPQSPGNFYRQSLPSMRRLNLDPHLVSGTLATEGLSDQMYNLLHYLDIASRPTTAGELPLNDFAKELLRALGYESRGIILRTRRDIPRPNLDYYSDAKKPVISTDVCLFQDSSSILLVVQGCSDDDSSDSEAQLIAKAIAAFQRNNHVRGRLGEAPLNLMNIPCILMAGTRPIFYFVPVTKALSDAVATKQRTYTPTVVEKCVVQSKSRLNEGMENTEFRREAFRHFAAFHALAETYWGHFMMDSCVNYLPSIRLRIKKSELEIAVREPVIVVE